MKVQICAVWNSIIRGLIVRGTFLSRVLGMFFCTMYTPGYAWQGVQADTVSQQKEAVNVFVDGYSQQDYLRREIQFVNYVRDPKQAEVYILVTELTTGSGGEEYTITFTGQQRFVGVNDTLKFITSPTDTEDETRRGIAQTIKLGLIRYAARTPVAREIGITFRRSETEIAAVKDKWNLWVFEIGFDADLDGEKSRKDYTFEGSISASRVTDKWKFSTDFEASRDKSIYETSIGEIESIKEGRYFNCLIVKSITNHLSVGMFGDFNSSTYSNIKLSFSAAPAVEYNIFPYSESTRRKFRFLYRIAGEQYKYREETIYFKTKEALSRSSLLISLDYVERWGTIHSSVEGSHYLHNFQKNNLQISNSIDFRITEGLSLDIMGDVSFIHDQLALPKRSASYEDVLLERTKLETQYEYSLRIGLSYTFGSRYSSVVNPRFETGGWH